MLVNIKVDSDTLVDMLLERLNYWTDDETTHKLYESMYENYAEGGVFESGEFDVMQIVDNDYVNWGTIISEDDEAYEGIKGLYEKEGLTDISCEYGLNNGYSFIEAEYDGSFLVRS